MASNDKTQLTRLKTSNNERPLSMPSSLTQQEPSPTSPDQTVCCSKCQLARSSSAIFFGSGSNINEGEKNGNLLNLASKRISKIQTTFTKAKDKLFKFNEILPPLRNDRSDTRSNSWGFIEGTQTENQCLNNQTQLLSNGTCKTFNNLQKSDSTTSESQVSFQEEKEDLDSFETANVKSINIFDPDRGLQEVAFLPTPPPIPEKRFFEDNDYEEILPPGKKPCK